MNQRVEIYKSQICIQTIIGCQNVCTTFFHPVVLLYHFYICFFYYLTQLLFICLEKKFAKSSPEHRRSMFAETSSNHLNNANEVCRKVAAIRNSSPKFVANLICIVNVCGNFAATSFAWLKFAEKSLPQTCRNICQTVFFVKDWYMSMP